jgi:uncharacterized protein (DUF736 family)
MSTEATQPAENKTFILHPGQGRIFKNDKKGNEKAPDFRGEAITPDGGKLKIAGWIQSPKGGGDNYISLKIEEDNYVKPTETADDILGSAPVTDQQPGNNVTF